MAAADKSAPVADDVIVFGLDAGGKAHASRFNAVDAELAEKAAGRMGMHVLRLVSEEQRAAAAGVPQGRIFASGKGFVPFVRMAVYEGLCAIAGIETSVPTKAVRPKKVAAMASAPDDGVTEPSEEAGGDKAGDASEVAAPRLPTSFAEIGVGSLVLAPETDKESWWPAIVLKPKFEGRWVLRWRDYPGDPPSFVRAQADLGLLNPDTKLA